MTTTRNPMQEMHDFLELSTAEQDRILSSASTRYRDWYAGLDPLARYRHDRNAVLYRIRAYRETQDVLPVKIFEHLIKTSQRRLAEIRAAYYL